MFSLENIISKENHELRVGILSVFCSKYSENLLFSQQTELQLPAVLA
jgi:hypothetical protein